MVRLKDLGLVRDPISSKWLVFLQHVLSYILSGHGLMACLSLFFLFIFNNGDFVSLDNNFSNPIIMQVKKVKPHVLLGLSGVGGVFNEEVHSH